MRSKESGLQFRDPDERILGGFKAQERLRRWHELKKQRQEEEQNG